MSAYANALVPWGVEVKTKDSHDAGIAASVFIKVYGEKGATQPIELEPFSDPDRPNVSNFSQSKKSVFELDREDVGMVTYIEVWHDAPTAWGLEYIRLQQGNNEWKFAPKSDRETIKSQRELDPQLTGIPKPTKMTGEYSAVFSGANRFHAAAKRDDYRAVEKMLQSQEYTVDVLDKVGRTATMYACTYGAPESLKVLLEYGCDLTKTDKLGRTALHYACMNDRFNLDIVNKLLSEQYVPSGAGGNSGDDDDVRGAVGSNEVAKRRGRYIRCRDHTGRTAMHYAASFGFFKLVQQLEAYCHIAITDKDSLGLTPLHCAALQGEAETARRLIELGAGSNVTAKDHEEKTFLHHAATAGHTAFIQYLYDYKLFNANTKKNLEALLETGDKLDRTPLLAAAGAGHLDTVKKLVDLKADIYHEDRDKSNIMHFAARKGGEALLTFASSKWDVNSTNDFKYTALHVAAEANNEAAMQWLVKHGADLEAQNLDGQTAFDMARDLGYQTMKRGLENAKEYLKAVKAASAAAGGGLDGGAPSALLDDMPVDRMGATPLASGGGRKKEPVAAASTTSAAPALSPDVMQLVRQNRELQSELHQTRLQLDEKRKGESFTKPPPTPQERQCDQGGCIIS